VPPTLLGGRTTLRADYWNYIVRDTIAPLSDAAIFGDPTKFASFLVRCNAGDPAYTVKADTCKFGGGGNPIAYVLETNANLGDVKTSGIDVAVNWAAQTGFGTISLNYRGTYVLTYDFQRVPGEAFFSRRNRYFDGFPVLGYSHYLALTLEHDALTLQI